MKQTLPTRDGVTLLLKDPGFLLNGVLNFANGDKLDGAVKLSVKGLEVTILKDGEVVDVSVGSLNFKDPSPCLMWRV